MAKDRIPVTPAIRALRAADVAFEAHPYRYEPNGGTRVSARELEVDEHQVVKTLVMETGDRAPIVVLMHGDCTVSTKELARQIGATRVTPCEPPVAKKHSGYEVGGTSPFGLHTPMPVYVEASILELPLIYINGGRRALVSLSPDVLVRVLGATPVTVALDR